MLAHLASTALALAAPASPERLLDLIRPIVGTARKDQRIGAVNSGQTFPAVGVPFGMTHWTPQTQASEDKCTAPFYAQDERIQGIRASHWWGGSCTHDYGSVTIAVMTGPLRPGAEERASAFARQDEVMTPAYCAVTLPDHGVRVEVTGTARAGVLRFTFLRGGEASLLVHANRKTQGAIPGSVARVDAARRAIAVSNPVQRIYAGSGRPAGFSGHVVVRVYTALYHALLQPRLFSDADGSYPRFGGGGAVERAGGFDYYDDFSLWDTFRAQHPLRVLLQPERVPDFVRSLLAKADEGGFLPNFPGWNSYTSAMIGDHGASVIVDAWVKGVRGFDGEAALRALVKNATQTPPYEEYADGKDRRALAEYLSLGYIPLEQEVKEAFHRREQVSRTLEYAYDDFAIAALARALGRGDVAAAFTRRAANWRNVFDPSIGFVRGRYADGR